MLYENSFFKDFFSFREHIADGTGTSPTYSQPTPEIIVLHGSMYHWYSSKHVWVTF